MKANCSSVIFSIGIFSVLLQVSLRCEARESRREPPIRYSQSAEEALDLSNRGLALGVSTLLYPLFGNVGGGFATPAFTAVMELSKRNHLQALFAIPATSPFNLGGALFYKRTVKEHRGAGFHLGGGLGVGLLDTIASGSALGVSLNGLAGFHFTLSGAPAVSIHVDAGPSLSLATTSPATTANFQVGALSPLLGLSLVAQL